MYQEIWFQKYRILRLLGSGGTARVYLASHIKLNSYRAIKCISKTHPLYDLQRNEALVLKNLKHSCIPIIYDIEEDEEGSYIVEQYLEGDTLKDIILTKGPIREDIIIDYAIQLCDLIHYLHSLERPILYVDLKPDNILISGKYLKLIDFGSAIYQDEYTKECKITATRGYAAPELYRQGKLDERCDIYGIGILLYFMASGTLISPSSMKITNIDQISDCSTELKSIINHCLKYNPALRYATAARLKKHLSALMRRKGDDQESSQRVIIAVAGAQPRIGVTHLAFRLCHYMKGQSINCLYRERNHSECIRRMKGSLGVQSEGEELLMLEGIPMMYRDPCDGQTVPSYQVTLMDYGVLNGDNLEQFLKADIKLLILGAKEWELAYSEEVLGMIAEYKDIIYLFNFLDGKQFQKVMKNMENHKCYRIPYEPNPFGKVTYQNGQGLFDEIIGRQSGRRKGIGRNILRKVRGYGPSDES